MLCILMRFGVVLTLMAIGVAVWVFAAIGLLTVARAVAEGGSVAPREPSLLVQVDAEVDGNDVTGLPRLPGALRTEYRQAIWDGNVVTEVEYRVIRDVEEVRDHLHRAIAAESWTVVSETRHHGEWRYRLARGTRSVTVSIEALAPSAEVEIEIEVVDPVQERGTVPGR
jgi:hypothetical protein